LPRPKRTLNVCMLARCAFANPCEASRKEPDLPRDQRYNYWLLHLISQEGDGGYECDGYC
jgi:hypothetical protein